MSRDYAGILVGGRDLIAEKRRSRLRETRDREAARVRSTVGRIMFLHPVKRFGRIEVPGEGRLYFNAINARTPFDQLVEGDSVSFVIGMDRSGQRVAKKVRRSHVSREARS